MGVQGLWQVLEPVGKLVTLESLEGKILCIDVSLWLHQAVRGNSAHRPDIRNPHLVTLFHRLLKLLFYRVRPIFVFDGPQVPLKQRVLSQRKLKRDIASLKLNKIQRQMLLSLAQDNLTGGESLENEEAAISQKLRRPTQNEDDLFHLPTEDTNLQHESDDCVSSDIEAEPQGDSSFSSEIDVESEDFQSLPMEIQRELLAELQERHKDTRASAEILPVDASDFSQFQLGKLLHKSQINQKLDSINRELTIRDSAMTLDWIHQQYGSSGGGLNVKKVIQENMRTRDILLEHSEGGFSAADLQKNLLPVESKVSKSCLEVADNSQAKICPEAAAEEESSSSQEGIPVPMSSINMGSSSMEQFESHSEPAVLRKEPSPTPVQISASCAMPVPCDSLILSQQSTVTICDHQEEQQDLIPSPDVTSDDNDSDFEDVQEVTLPDSPRTSSPVSLPRIKEAAAQSASTSAGPSFSDLCRQRQAAESAEQSMTEQIYEDCQRLLGLFGVPWVVSPGEAEAECAELELKGLCSGVITDDSDVFLFGATHVYRNVFNRQRNTQFYSAMDIQNVLGLTREKLVSMAMLTGCDYTDGVESVGAVTALEVMAEFGDGLDGLLKFRDWWTEAQTRIPAQGFNLIRSRLKKLSCVFPPSFPDSGVREAFLSPNVEASTEKFAWGSPNQKELEQFVQQKIGWTPQKLNELLLPVLPKLHSCPGAYQTHISSFFVNLPKDPTQMKLSPSKRVESALKRIRGQEAEPEKAKGQKKPKSGPMKRRKGQRRNQARKARPSKMTVELSESSSEEDEK